MTTDGLPRPRSSRDDDAPADGRPGYDAVRVAAMLDQLAADFAQFDESLDADLWMSSTVGHMMLQLEPEEDPHRTMVWALEDVLRYVEESPTAVAVAFLRASEILTPMRLRSRVQHAITNAVLAGVPDPVWARTVAMRVGPCWRLASPGGAVQEVVISFRGDGAVGGDSRRGHLLHTVIGGDGAILDIGFAEDVEGYRRRSRAEAGHGYEELTPEDARGLLMPALSVPLDLGQGDHVAEALAHFALLRSRAGLLPAPAGAAFFRG